MCRQRWAAAVLGGAVTLTSGRESQTLAQVQLGLMAPRHPSSFKVVQRNERDHP